MLLIWCAIWPGAAGATTLAVASSLAPAARELTALDGLEGVHLVSAASGTLLGHMSRGAPYDVVILVGENWALRGQKLATDGQMYCLAQAPLAIWAPRIQLPQELPRELLARPEWRIALPNPAVAPAGQAALELLDQWGVARADLLRSGSAAHSLHMARRGAADLALLPLPLARAGARAGPPGGTLLQVEAPCCRVSYYALLLQQSQQARQLFARLRSVRVQQKLKELGFEPASPACQPTGEDDAESG